MQTRKLGSETQVFYERINEWINLSDCIERGPWEDLVMYDYYCRDSRALMVNGKEVPFTFTIKKEA